MNNYDILIQNQEEKDEIRNKLFDEMIYRLDNELCDFRKVLELMQSVAKDYKGEDFSRELEEHLKEQL